jgi:hypothetical protein
MTLPDRMRLWAPVHAAANVLRWVGLRDRLRCPACRSVGTWKPHGTLADRRRHGDRPVRRWLCKWCGHYVGPEGVLRCFPDQDLGVWSLPRPFRPDAPDPPPPTPMEAVAERLGKVWPWRG